MGLFSFLSSNKLNYKDKVWKASEFCLKGMMTDALLAITGEKNVVVVSHFADRQEKILQFLSTNKVPHFLVESGNTSDGLQQSHVVHVLNHQLIQSHEGIEFLSKLSSKKSIDLLFFGHYPLPSKETKLLDRISLIKSLTTTFYSSLDEPSFEIFGAANITSIMEKLGMKDEEAIEHAMVSKSMERARQKIEEKVKYEHEAVSEKEWFQKNLKS